MTERFDVAARFAEGRPAVEHTQSYVWAAHLLGYQHPDLTLHGSQVRDWFDSEDGMDLRVLDDDCAELWTAVDATDEALRVQRAVVGGLAADWVGPGADAAAEFLQGHCDAGAMVAAALRTAAESCSALRERLWEIVDAKVAAAVSIDDRSQVQRPVWLAAAQTVTTGVGDRSIAEELVDKQVKPYVDNDIRMDWLSVMRSAEDAVAATYEGAIDELRAVPAARFEIPGDFGPRYHPLPDEPVGPRLADPFAPAAAALHPGDSSAGTTPDAPEALPPVAPLAPRSRPASAVAAAPAGGVGDLPSALSAPELAAPLGDVTGLPASTSGAGGLGSLGALGSLGGLGSRIVDAISGLLSSPDEGLADSPAFGDSASDDDPFDDEASDEADEEAEDRPNEEDEPVQDVAEEQSEDVGTSTQPGPTPAETSDAAEPPTVQEATETESDALPLAQPRSPAVTDSPSETAGSTPCEIAADELPQAGQ